MRNFTLGLAIGLVVAIGGAAFGKQSQCSNFATACGKKVADSLQGRGWLGLELRHDPEVPSRFEVTRVFDHGPAVTADLRQGDALAGIDEVRFKELDFKSAESSLREKLGSIPPGHKTVLHLIRGSESLSIEMNTGFYSERAYAEILGRNLLAEAPELVVGVLEPRLRSKRKQ